MSRHQRLSIEECFSIAAVVVSLSAWLPASVAALDSTTKPEEIDSGPSSKPTAEETVASNAKPLVVDDVLDVVDHWQPIAAVEVRGREDLPSMPIGDGADLLRGFSGVALGRMGGHGLEPWIRGLGESNLNVLVDGAYIHGGCPNRMDPPTAFAATSGFDRVTVIKGVQSLLYGAGGSAGTVLYERLAPPPTEETTWRIDASGGVGSWTDRPAASVEASWSAQRFYLRADAESRSFDSYKDGNGDVVRSAYSSRMANVIVGVGDRARAFLELGYEQGLTDDALFAGAGMDSPEDRSDTLRLDYHYLPRTGRWRAFETELYLSRVDHLMDNYSLRSLSAPMALRVPTKSDTSGGRASGRMDFAGGGGITLGVDYQRNQRLALRYAGASPERVDKLQSVMWPDADLSQGGVFVEGERDLASGSRVRFGLRADSFAASADQADRQPVGANPSPNDLYRLYYGRPAEDWSDSGLSALLRYERPLGSAWTLFTGASRSLRAPDATERYLAAGSPAAIKRWIGNPDLGLAEHHQIDLGLARAAGGRRWSTAVFVDEVQNFILRDRARAQKGIAASDGASIYRNIDARLFGLEVDAGWTATETLGITANASWVRGENRSDDRPLAQIPALQGRIAAEHVKGSWRGAAALRWALEQDRVDDDPRIGSGLDFGPTPGHAVLDLQAGVRLRGAFEILAGLDNVFDRAYAQHLNRGNLFDPDPVRVNEPGRTAWLRLRWQTDG